MKTLLLALLLCSTASAATSVYQRNGFSIFPGVSTIAGTKINGITATGFSINGFALYLDAEVTAWSAGIQSASPGSRPNTKSSTIANTLSVVIKQQSYSAKIVYLLPLLGQDIAATLMPLRDSLTAGYADNVGGAFVNGDFTEATGVQGNGSTKIINTKITPSQLGTTNNGGIGYWETNIAFDGTTTWMAAAFNNANSNFFGVYADGSLLGRCYWGGGSNYADSGAGTATNGHYYGQRSGSTSREIFKNGSSAGTNTTSDATSGASERTIAFPGYHINASYAFFHGRCAVFYLTDGTMSSGDASSFNTLLLTYLFTPTGRPSS